MRADGEAKRTLIYETAMARFRAHGFDTTTMRDIARDAGISLGSAYHYFPSKVAIVFEYYEQVQGEHERIVARRMKKADGLRERLGVVFDSKLELVRRDRKLLAAIASTLVVPGDPMSAFSDESGPIRERAIRLFRAPVEAMELDAKDEALLAQLLWAAHLGILLFLVHDESRGQARSKRMNREVLDRLSPLIQLTTTPLGAGILAHVGEVMALLK